MVKIIKKLNFKRFFYQAIETRNECSVAEYVKKVCENRDREALENWRGFYTRFLAPLDVEAQKIIKQYSYLINDDASEGMEISKKSFYKILPNFRNF